MKIRIKKNSLLKASRSIAAFMALLVAIISLSGVLVFMNDSQSSHGGCPFMQHSQSLCQMGPINHIAHWQQLFTSLPVQLINILIAGLMAVFVLLLAAISRAFASPHLIEGRAPPEKYTFKSYNYFIDLFSRGILHSRLYA